MAKTKSILIIGGSGFVGTHLAMALRHDYKVFMTYRTHPVLIPGVTNLPFGDSERNWIKRVVYMARPSVTIFVAGSNDTARAEEKPRETESIQSGVVANTVDASEIFQSKFIFISNCYVFDGRKGNFKEGDNLLASTALGKAKIGGENFVRGRCLNYLIVRSSPIIGFGNGYNFSFLDLVRMKLARGERVEVPHTEYHSFVYIDAFIDFMKKLVEVGIKNRVFHIGGLTKLSFYEFAMMFAEHNNLDTKLIVPHTFSASGDSGFMFDYSLNFTRSVQTLKIKPLFLEDALNLLK